MRGIYQGNNKSPRVLDSCRGQRPLRDFVSLSGHGVTLFPNRVLYSHAGLVGTAEDLSSQITKSKCHVIGQVIQITCKVM
jgi:hypothetical protein